MNALKRILHIGGIKSNQRILPNFGAANGLSLDLIDGALATIFFLGESEPRHYSAYRQ